MYTLLPNLLTKKKSCKKLYPPKFSGIFNSRVYSYVGCIIQQRHEAVFSKDIIETITTEEGHHSTLNSFSALQHGIALLQLSQDENRQKSEPPAVGY